MSGCEGGPSPTSGSTDGATPTSTPAPVTTTAATEGAGELANATIAMPFVVGTVGTGALPSTPLKYTNGEHEGEAPYSWSAIISATARADVNGDGADEIIARAECSVSDGTTYQVFALRPDVQGGWATLSEVVSVA